MSKRKNIIYAVIAAGEGSRLAEEGYPNLKPMVEIHGEMLIDRLIAVFQNNHASEIILIINEKSKALKKHIQNLMPRVPVQLIVKDTPSSLHSFSEILAARPDIDSLCLTTTDTVFNEAEFSAYISHFVNSADEDALMAVTSFVDDESPLYVDFDQDMKISSFSNTSNGELNFVSGGIYCLRKNALNVVHQSIRMGISRMRNFQRELLNNGLNLKAYPFSKIIDIDHVSDIKKAEIFLKDTSVI